MINNNATLRQSLEGSLIRSLIALTQFIIAAGWSSLCAPHGVCVVHQQSVQKCMHQFAQCSNQHFCFIAMTQQALPSRPSVSAAAVVVKDANSGVEFPLAQKFW